MPVAAGKRRPKASAVSAARLRTYDRLDLVAYTDCQHQTWRYVYDDNQRLVMVADP